MTSDHEHTQNLTEDKTIGLPFVQAKYLLSCSLNATVLNTVHYWNLMFRNELRIICPFTFMLPFFTDLTTFFCLKMLLLLSMILLSIIFIIKLKTIHRSSDEYTVHKSSLYALRNNSVCINKDALPLITMICFRVFNNTVFNNAVSQFLILNV